MLAIYIAAGLGKRMSPLTDQTPKCLLPLFGKSLFALALEKFQQLGVTRTTVITGHAAAAFQGRHPYLVNNKNYRDNNILHSLMCARSQFVQAIEADCDLIISYSDIYFTKSVLERLVASSADINLCIDQEWHLAYEGRTDHPLSEAELAFTEGNQVQLIGKGRSSQNPKHQCGEFIGLLKLSPRGCQLWLQHFDQLNQRLSPQTPFQLAKEWQKSYLTDFFQDLIDHRHNVHAVSIKRGWMEFDTVQDYKKYAQYKSEQDYNKP